MLTKPSLTLVRRLKASPAKVYAAWTEPERIAEWFGPADVTVVSAAADPRVNGAFRVVMRAADGEIHNVSGIYREVVPGARLVFTWSWISTPERVSLVTVSIRPTDEGSELTLRHEQFFNEAARDGHQGGWTEALDKLEALFASQETER
jgi:uncharacterized protein YndB with AHSA1/START domain